MIPRMLEPLTSHHAMYVAFANKRVLMLTAKSHLQLCRKAGDGISMQMLAHTSALKGEIGILGRYM